MRLVEDMQRTPAASSSRRQRGGCGAAADRAGVGDAGDALYRRHEDDPAIFDLVGSLRGRTSDVRCYNRIKVYFFNQKSMMKRNKKVPYFMTLFRISRCHSKICPGWTETDA